MRIIKYQCRDTSSLGWNFVEVEFQSVNLLVGNSASGKTRFLNTLFNLGRFVCAKEFRSAWWVIVFEHAGSVFRWELESYKEEGDDEGVIVKDNLWQKDSGSDDWLSLIKRDQERFLFQDTVLPKLSHKETSISLLKEEELIRPIYEAFSLIWRRRFFAEAVSRIAEFHTVPIKLLDDLAKGRKKLSELLHPDINLNVVLYILSLHDRTAYFDIVEQFKSTFPFVEDMRIVDFSKVHPNVGMAANVPVPQIRERDSDSWVSLSELSSGMQKVLLILTDLQIIPEGGVYLIDEYENSLGINAIDFFPEHILTLTKPIQFFITSHHPYIINRIPVRNWYVFHRNGTQVSVTYGEEVEKRYGRSRQQAFIQLINDPLFSIG